MATPERPAEAAPLREADGAIRVGQTRVSLEAVIGAFQEGAGPEEIVLRYPSHAATIRVTSIFGDSPQKSAGALVLQSPVTLLLIPLLLALYPLSIFWVAIAASRASSGKLYQYPLCVPILR